MRDAAAVMAGGAAGTLARAGLAEALPVHPGTWPWATFAGQHRGLADPRLGRGRQARSWRPLVGTGFCGALTTFSTFQVQIVVLGDDGHVALAAAYLAVSVAGGLAAAARGSQAGRRRA